MISYKQIFILIFQIQYTNTTKLLHLNLDVRDIRSIRQLSRNEQGGVTVAEETEIVAQGVTVDGFPVAVYKGRYKQQQRALRLMEVCDHHLHNMALLTRSNDYLGACLKHIQDCCAWDKKG